MSAPIRIGCVPYLNSKVLIHGLAPHGYAPDGTRYALELAPPSALAKRLAAGELDVALVSSIEFFRNPGYTILPGLGVCGHGEMWSIRLFHHVPLQELRRVALDPASETTNALLRIVLKERHGVTPEFSAPAKGAADGLGPAFDAWLKIGDPCLRLLNGAPGWTAHDLLADWLALTGLPFVFAAWLVRGGAHLAGIPALLAQAKDSGLRHVEEIARQGCAETGLSLEQAREYVEKIVRYEIGAGDIKALGRFGQYLSQLDARSSARQVEFYRG